jgi:hypothetical protein
LGVVIEHMQSPADDKHSELCRCGIRVLLSNSWWHRSVCTAWQEERRPLESMVETVARAMAVSEGVETWEAYLDLARPAIAALRVPTAAMVDAGSVTVWNRDALVAAYQAMVDAAAL